MNTRLPTRATWRRRAPALALLACIATASVAAATADTGAPSARHTDSVSASANDDAQGTVIASPRHVIAGGGGSSSGGAFAIQGTIGQVDADPLHPASGGVFAITGGFWPGPVPSVPLGDPIFANGFEAPLP